MVRLAVVRVEQTTIDLLRVCVRCSFTLEFAFESRIIRFEQLLAGLLFVVPQTHAR